MSGANKVGGACSSPSEMTVAIGSDFRNHAAKLSPASRWGSWKLPPLYRATKCRFTGAVWQHCSHGAQSPWRAKCWRKYCAKRFHSTPLSLTATERRGYNTRQCRATATRQMRTPALQKSPFMRPPCAKLEGGCPHPPRGSLATWMRVFLREAPATRATVATLPHAPHFRLVAFGWREAQVGRALRARRVAGLRQRRVLKELRANTHVSMSPSCRAARSESAPYPALRARQATTSCNAKNANSFTKNRTKV